MVRLYHGTSYEAAIDIIHNGFKSPDTIWSCSELEKTYFVKSKCDDDEDYDIDRDDAVMFAVDASKIAAAHFDSKSTSTFLFELKMSDEIFDEEMSPDISCENADGCWCINSKTLNELISDGTVIMTAYILKDSYNPWLRPFYLYDLSEYYKTDDEVLRKVMTCLRQSNVMDSMCDYLFGYSGIEIYTEVEPAAIAQVRITSANVL